MGDSFINLAEFKGAIDYNIARRSFLDNLKYIQSDVMEYNVTANAIGCAVDKFIKLDALPLQNKDERLELAKKRYRVAPLKHLVLKEYSIPKVLPLAGEANAIRDKEEIQLLYKHLCNEASVLPCKPLLQQLALDMDTIDLRSCVQTGDGLVLLLQTLAHENLRVKVHSLDLSYTFFQRKGKVPIEKQFVGALSGLHDLIYLNLSGNRIRTAHGVLLLQTLSSAASKLQELVLSDNLLEDGISHALGLLRINPSLTMLDLVSNSMIL